MTDLPGSGITIHSDNIDQYWDNIGILENKMETRGVIGVMCSLNP